MLWHHTRCSTLIKFWLYIMQMSCCTRYLYGHLWLWALPRKANHFHGSKYVTWSRGMCWMFGILILRCTGLEKWQIFMVYIVFELQRIIHISAGRCPIEMGPRSKCSILNEHVIFIEKSKLNITDMWLIQSFPLLVSQIIYFVAVSWFVYKTCTIFTPLRLHLIRPLDSVGSWCCSVDVLGLGTYLTTMLRQGLESILPTKQLLRPKKENCYIGVTGWTKIG